MTVRDARWISHFCNLMLWFSIAVLCAVGCAERHAAKQHISTIENDNWRCVVAVEKDRFLCTYKPTGQVFIVKPE